MSDEFFDDEQELMEQVAPQPKADSAKEKEPVAAPAAASAATPQKSSTSARQAPPFWMVLAIAAIALILGVVIGYLLGTSATLAELSAASADATQSAETTSSDASSQLPAGHPDLDIDEDGNATLADTGSAE